MAGKRKSHADGDMLLGAYNCLGDCSVTHRVQVGYVVLPTNRRGVFLIRCRAARVAPDGSKRTVAEVEREYPNSMVEGLGACLYNCAYTLERRVTEALSVEMAIASE